MSSVATLIIFAINYFISSFRLANIVGIISLIIALMVVWIICTRLLSSEVLCSMGLRTLHTRLWLDFGMGVWPGFFSVETLSPAWKWVSDWVFDVYQDMSHCFIEYQS